MSLFKKNIAQPDDRRSPKVQEMLAIARQAWTAGNLSRAENAFAEAADVAKKMRAFPDAVEGLLDLASLHHATNPNQAIHELNECEEIARSHLSKPGLSRVLHKVATGLSALGHVELAKAKFAEGIALDEKSGDTSGWIGKLISLCALNRQEGLYSDCYEMCCEGIRVSEAGKNIPASFSISLTLVELLLDVFEAPEEAQEQLHSLSVLAPRYGDGQQRVELEYQKARLALRQGRLAEADERLGKVAMSARYTRQTSLLLSAQLALADLCVARQSGEELYELLEHLTTFSEMQGNPRVGILRTRLALHQNRLRDAVETVEQIPQQKGWPELERSVLLAVVEARMGVTAQALAYLRYAEQMLDTIQEQTPLEFQQNLERKAEVVELTQIRELIR